MAIQTDQIDVTTEAVKVNFPDATVSSLLIRNETGADLFWGGPGVTTSTGMLLKDGEAQPIDLDPNEGCYIVAASGGSGVYIASVGVPS